VRDVRNRDWNLDGGRHGRAWQQLAARVENCFVRFTGLPADLARLYSLSQHGDRLWASPSLHDSEVLMAFYTHAVLDEPEAGPVRLVEFARGWWADPPALATVVRDGKEWYKVDKRNRLLCGVEEETIKDECEWDGELMIRVRLWDERADRETEEEHSDEELRVEEEATTPEPTSTRITLKSLLHFTQSRI
jgi:hypothetical protein